MARKSYTTEQIIGLLRQAEVMLSQGKTLDTVKPKAAFAITSMCERAMWRYRDPRSWRAVMIDAGHALHMYKRVAGMLGLEIKTSQRFKSTEVAKVLGINAIEQPVLSVGVFGEGGQ